LKDKFGVSWQIVPDVLPKMINEKDREKSKRVMEAMMQMVRLDIDEL
jgi:predicted 3-demethylubiquinone-9 3-methyltransferase (glyoxalase superfamily)